MSSKPDAPDPYATANAQQQANIGAAQSSNISGNYNEVDAMGNSINYSYDPNNTVRVQTGQNRDGSPIYSNIQQGTRTVSLSPEQQAIANANQQTQGNIANIGTERSASIGDTISGNIDYDQFQAYGERPDVAQLKGSEGIQRQGNDPMQFIQQGQAVQKALFDRSNEQLQRNWNDKKSHLAAIGGYAPQSAAGDKYFDQNRAENDLAMASVLAGGQEQSRLLNEQRQAGRFDLGLNQADDAASTNMWNMGQENAGYDNSLRNQQIMETYAARSQPINEVAALMSGGQVSLPNFQAARAGTINPANIGNMVFDAYGNEMDAYNSQMSDMAALAGAGLGFATGNPYAVAKSGQQLIS